MSQDLEKQVNNFEDQTCLLVITNQKEYEEAGRFLQAGSELSKQIRETFEPIIQKAHAAHKEAVKQKNKHLDPIQKALSMIKSKMVSYVDMLKLKETEVQSAAKEKNMPAQIVPKPKAEGIYTTERWTYEITDINKLPREYLLPDEKKIRTVVSAMKDLTNIPGVKVFKTTGIGSRNG